MSRLDSFIRRLEAQRACLNRAAELIARLDGVVLELGLGNGRTYDHLRELFPHRDIYVCERRVAAHPDCIPPDERLLFGDMFETLPAARFLAGRVALAHFDAGTGDAAANLELAAGLRPLILPLLCADGVLVTQPPMDGPELAPLPLPDGVTEGRYHLYRRGSPTAPSRIEGLLAWGKERGYLTYEELNAALPSDLMSSEQIEGILHKLTQLGVMVVENPPD